MKSIIAEPKFEFFIAYNLPVKFLSMLRIFSRSVCSLFRGGDIFCQGVDTFLTYKQIIVLTTVQHAL